MTEEEKAAHQAEITRIKEAMQKRIDKQGEKISALEGKNTELTTANSSLQSQVSSAPDAGRMAKRLEKAEGERDDLKSEFATFKSESTTRESMMSVGITDAEDMALVRWHHAKLDNAPDFNAWLGKEAKEHKHLAGLFTSADTTTTDTATTQQTQQTTRPIHSTVGGGNGGVRGPAPAGEVRDLAWLGRQSNDWHNNPANRKTRDTITGGHAADLGRPAEG